MAEKTPYSESLDAWRKAWDDNIYSNENELCNAIIMIVDAIKKQEKIKVNIYYYFAEEVSNISDCSYDGMCRYIIDKIIRR